ncbi:MAG: hypothetical protein ACREI2_04335 [Nitrospiraceae bacterium]
MAPSNNPPSQVDPTTPGQADSSSSVIKLLHYLVVGLLLLGGLAYWLLKPPALNPMADAQAAEAMALVQTHKAQRAPTLRQALTDRVQAMAARGQGVRLGEWRVERERGEVYLVRIVVREEGTKQWFEREYIWRVNPDTRSVVALTLPAADLMPVEPGTLSP